MYINLSDRTDRRISIEAELSSYFPVSKISRFNAIRHEKGYIGCTMSHIGAIKIAIEKRWKNCLIVEDDAIWSKLDEGYPLLKNLARNPYDIITLGTTFTTYNHQTYKLHSGQTTTAYLINSSYYQTYMDNMVEGLSNLVESNSPGHYALDIYWKKLQARDNWYCIMPAIMVQKEGYSDIEKRNVNYDHYFNIQQIAK